MKQNKLQEEIAEALSLIEVNTDNYGHYGGMDKTETADKLYSLITDAAVKFNKWTDTNYWEVIPAELFDAGYSALFTYFIENIYKPK